MDTIRILHIINGMGRGGIESRIMDLYRHIDREQYQYDFYIVSGEKRAYNDEIIALGGRIFNCERQLKHNLPNLRAFRSFLDAHPEYKIVYAYDQWSGWYLKQALKCSVPYRIANARTSLEVMTLKNIVKSLATLNVNKYATHRFAVSKKAGKWLYGTRALNNGIVKVWPNAIDTSLYSFSESIREQTRKNLGIDSDELVFMRVANIYSGKNYPFTLKLFAEFNKLNDRVRLVIIGGGDNGKLKDLAHELNIENKVQFLGVRADIPDLLLAGDICLCTSFYEGFPGAVLEAEASGQWCFISDAITDEVVLTDHIMRIPLSYGESRWAQIITEKYRPVDRTKASEQIAAAGYDISQLAKDTMSFYRSLTI